MLFLPHLRSPNSSHPPAVKFPHTLHHPPSTQSGLLLTHSLRSTSHHRCRNLIQSQPANFLQLLHQTSITYYHPESRAFCNFNTSSSHIPTLHLTNTITRNHGHRSKFSLLPTTRHHVRSRPVSQHNRQPHVPRQPLSYLLNIIVLIRMLTCAFL